MTMEVGKNIFIVGRGDLEGVRMGHGGLEHGKVSRQISVCSKGWALGWVSVIGVLAMRLGLASIERSEESKTVRTQRDGSGCVMVYCKNVRRRKETHRQQN